MEKILILTGGSKGIGSGIIAAYSQAGYRIFSVSRTKNEEGKFEKLEQIQFDLSNTSGLESIVNSIFTVLNKDKVEKITLINNAGTIGPIKRLEKISPEDIERTVRLNTVAPLILTSLFIKFTKDWKCPKKIITVSSGAAINPYYGWTTYCSTKAAVDMMTKAVTLEQSRVEHGAKTIAIYPGVVDTGMQEQIRSTEPADFIELNRFIDYKNSGALVDKDIVGQEIYAIGHNESYESGAIINIKDTR